MWTGTCIRLDALTMKMGYVVGYGLQKVFVSF